MPQSSQTHSLAMSDNNSWIIRNGQVIDPRSGERSYTDIMITAGKISAIGKDLPSTGVPEVDCSGLIVTPGLVDLHTHLYQHATPLGVDPDLKCLARGVTTAVDGGSAGALTYRGLQHFIIDKSQTRVLAFLHIACHGLAGAGCSGPEFGPGGESDHVNALKTDLCVRTIKSHEGVIVGVKVRLDRNITDGGRNEPEVFKRALAAARQGSVPLMIHHTNSTIPLEEVLSSLMPGDIFTHTFSTWAGVGSSIVDREARSVNTSVLQAREKGVLFDVGHGQGSFDWEVAEICASSGFYPDTISTDLHSGNVDGAARDLPWVMTKLYHLGMTLPDIIKAVTQTPATAIGYDDTIGVLDVGREADITVLEVTDGKEVAEDAVGNKRTLQKMIQPKIVWRNGIMKKIM